MGTTDRVSLPFHQGWVMVIAGVFTLFACLGLGRFALGMLLPAMGTDLQLSYSEMGFISTGNFIGYLFSVVISGRLSQMLGIRATIFCGLMLVGLSMLLISQSQHFIPLLILYLLTGIGTGLANIPVMVLIAQWFYPSYRGRAAGCMIIGNGMGIVFSGLLIPWLNHQWGDIGWRIAWFSSGSLVILIGWFVYWVVRNTPAQMGLLAVGADEPAGREEPHISSPKINPRRLLVHLGSIYFLFGFTYVIYVTFIVTTLIQEHKFSESVAGWFWIGVGILSMVSSPLFGILSDRLGRKTAMILVFTLQTSAYLLAASGLGQSVLFVSMALFGISAFSLPAIIVAIISDHLEPAQAATVFGYVTLFFGVGQISGPSLAGVLAEYSGSFSISYLLAAAMTSIAILLTLRLNNASQ